MTPPMGDLLALASRVEQLAGPSEEIDLEIAEWLFSIGKVVEYDPRLWADRHCFEPTRSIDDSEKLVFGGPNAWRRLTEQAVAVYAASPYNAAAQVRHDGYGPSVAIQMVAAALKCEAAKQAKTEATRARAAIEAAGDVGEVA